MGDLQRIKEYRRKRHMTQSKLASASGVSRQTISNIESGKQAEVKASTLLNIANALGVAAVNFLPKKSSVTRQK